MNYIIGDIVIARQNTPLIHYWRPDWQGSIGKIVDLYDGLIFIEWIKSPEVLRSPSNYNVNSSTLGLDVLPPSPLLELLLG